MLQAEHEGAESNLMECAPPLLVWSVLFAVPLEMLKISGDNRFSVVAALANYTRYL